MKESESTQYMSQGEGEDDSPVNKKRYYVGLNPKTLGSWPEPKDRCLIYWATQVPLAWEHFKLNSPLKCIWPLHIGWVIMISQERIFSSFYTVTRLRQAIFSAVHSFFFFFKVLFIYSWETEWERGRDTGRGRSRLHAGSPMWDSILGLQDHTLG